MSNKRILPISIAVTLGLSLTIILTLALIVGPVASQEPDESARAVDKLQAIGQAVGGDTEATLIGAGIGAAGGYIIGNEQDKKK